MSSSLLWHCLSFQQLTPLQLYYILQLRADVFVVEQTCPYLDPDGKDTENCWHIFAEDSATKVISAYCRVLAPNSAYSEAAIGRVVVESSCREQGLGKTLMRKAITVCQQQWPELGITLSAQCQWEGFYKKLGFNPQGDSYLEDGIPHIRMQLDRIEEN